jgi:uroporphyrinogen decarboxylase
MNDVENALRIIRFDSPERVMETVPGWNVSFYGRKDEPWDPDAQPRGLAVGESRTDMWGTVTTRRHEGPSGTEYHGALQEPADLEGFDWPDPDDERICARIYHMAEQFPGGDRWLSGGHGCLIWEIAYRMVGMENLLVYFHTEPDFVREVFRRIGDFHMGLARHFMEVGVRSVGFSDDLAMQSGPFFGPDILEEFFMPQYKRVFRFYNERDVIVGQHCDGNVLPLIDFFEEAGLDILNPVQVTANDLAAVRERTQGRICLHGGISNVTITDGPPEAVEMEVWRHIWLLGREGGYFCCVDHSMPAPDEHWDAFHEAVEKHGRYPIEPPPDAGGR